MSRGAKVSQVGSTKTYKRILDATDPLDELNIEKQITNYEAAISYIAILRSSDRPAVPTIPVDGATSSGPPG